MKTLLSQPIGDKGQVSLVIDDDKNLVLDAGVKIGGGGVGSVDVKAAYPLSALLAPAEKAVKDELEALVKSKLPGIVADEVNAFIDAAWEKVVASIGA